MNMVDDATGTTQARLGQQETTWAAAGVLRSWIEQHGVPLALYTDWKNVYKVAPTPKQELRGEEPLTQFGDMCARLGIRIIAAHSPQAKGRVERKNGVHQDRLVKKLRRKQIHSYAAANTYLDAEYLPGLNQRFAQEPQRPEDYHRAPPSAQELDQAFRLESARWVSNDWVVRYAGRYFKFHPAATPRYFPLALVFFNLRTLCPLFCTLFLSNVPRISTLRTLSAKHPGYTSPKRTSGERWSSRLPRARAKGASIASRGTSRPPISQRFRSQPRTALAAASTPPLVLAWHRRFDVSTFRPANVLTPLEPALYFALGPPPTGNVGWPILLRGGPMRRGVLIFTSLLLCVFASSSPAQTVDQIVAKVFAARGGLIKIRALKAQRVSGTISFGADASGPFFVELKRPLRMHMQITMQNLTMVRVYDGKSGWANNPFAGKMNPDPMTEEDLKNISEEVDFDGPLVDYKKKGNQVELVGKDKVEDKDAWRLRLTTKNGDVRSYLFDAGSFLLLKWEGRRKAEGKDIPVESYFRDYRDVEGLKFAFEIDSGSSVTDLSQKIIIAKIELNPQLADSEFTKPATPGKGAAPPPNPSAPSGTAGNAPPAAPDSFAPGKLAAAWTLRPANCVCRRGASARRGPLDSSTP
jgi:outer membrane lipoprotein-sorting protein